MPHRSSTCIGNLLAAIPLSINRQITNNLYKPWQAQQLAQLQSAASSCRGEAEDQLDQLELDWVLELESCRASFDYQHHHAECARAQAEAVDTIVRCCCHADTDTKQAGQPGHTTPQLVQRKKSRLSKSLFKLKSSLKTFFKL